MDSSPHSAPVRPPRQDRVQQAPHRRPIPRRLEPHMHPRRQPAVHIQRQRHRRPPDRQPVLLIHHDQVQHRVVQLHPLQRPPHARPRPHPRPRAPLPRPWPPPQDGHRPLRAHPPPDRGPVRQGQRVRCRATTIGLAHPRHDHQVHGAHRPLRRRRPAFRQHPLNDLLHLRAQPRPLPPAPPLRRWDQGPDVSPARLVGAQLPLHAAPARRPRLAPHASTSGLGAREIPLNGAPCALTRHLPPPVRPTPWLWPPRAPHIVGDDPTVADGHHDAPVLHDRPSPADTQWYGRCTDGPDSKSPLIPAFPPHPRPGAGLGGHPALRRRLARRPRHPPRRPQLARHPPPVGHR